MASLAIAASMLPLAPVAPSPAHAGSDDVIAVVVEGIGYGHGRGMSQWGAYGWAVDQGKAWGWILDHYYGGTVSGSVGTDARIRVRLLAADGRAQVGVVSHGPGVSWNGSTAASMYAVEVATDVFDVYSTSSITCPGGTTMTVPDGPLSYSPPVTYNADVLRMQQFLDTFHDSSIDVDGYFGPQTQAILISWQTAQALPANGVWDLDDATRAREIIAASGGGGWTRIGAAVTGPIVFTTANGDTPSAAPGSVLGLCDGGGAVVHYRGKIEFLNTGSGNRVVNDVRVEDYLRGVVPKEIAASWADSGGGSGANAVRAQAVAARSYGLQQARYPYAGTCDSMACQVYGGAAKRGSATGGSSSVEDARTDAAIAATAGVVRLWPAGHPQAGQIVSTEFSASNGPRTAGGAFTAVDDVPGDGTAKNPNHRWTRVFDAHSLAAQYGLGRITGAEMVEAASATYRAFDGIWFNDIVLTGTSGTFRQQAWDFRGVHGLRSPGFTVRVITEDTTPRSIGVIGDSVAASVIGGGSSEFDRLIDGTFLSATLDVAPGRCTRNIFCPGTSGVEAAGGLPYGLDLVVVELGYNDWPPGFAADIDAMMAALAARGAKQVAWVNMADILTGSGGGSTYGPANQALVAATARWPNLTILDWNAASNHGERPRWFSDGVHLTLTGQAEFALWLRAAMLDPSLLPASRWLVPPKKITLPVAGVALTTPAGSPVTVPSDARAVALNITAVGPVAPGFATVWPCTSSQTDTSNLNYVTGDVVANSVIAPIGADGTVCFWSSIGTDFLVDVSGWFPAASAASTFESMTPHRVVDTRHGIGGPQAPVSPASPLVVELGGATVPQPGGGSVTIPADASAVAVNLTAVDTAAAGFATVWPCARPRPDASHLNFGAGDTVANTVVAPLDGNGEFCVFMDKPGHVLVDVAGWFPADSGGGYVSAVSKRVVDTRSGARARPSVPLAVPVRGATLQTAGGAAAVPASATAVAINLTVVGSDVAGFGTVWPCGAQQPDASNINFVPGSDVANGVIAPIGVDGSICVFTSTDAHVIVDLTGWFSGGGEPSFVGTVPKRLVDTRNAIGPIPR